eukprot:scaffold6136_cov96-Isochrysis_galbana.AAC.5
MWPHRVRVRGWSRGGRAGGRARIARGGGRRASFRWRRADGRGRGKDEISWDRCRRGRPSCSRAAARGRRLEDSSEADSGVRDGGGSRHVPCSWRGGGGDTLRCTRRRPR